MKKYTLHTMDGYELANLIKTQTWNDYSIKNNKITIYACESPIAEIDCKDSQLQGKELVNHLQDTFRRLNSFIHIIA